MGDVVEFAAVVTVVMGAIFSFRLFSVLIKRLERPRSADSVHALEERLERLEEWQEHQQRDAQERLLELEERVDFAERLLGQQRQLPESDRKRDSIG